MAAAVSVILAAGCGDKGPNSVADRTYRGVPAGLLTFGDGTDPVAVIEPDDKLALAVWGGSSCPSVPVAFDILNRHEVGVTLVENGARVCTADLGPTTSEFSLDSQAVDTGSDIRVVIRQAGRQPVTVIAHPPSGPPLPQAGTAPADAAAAVTEIRAAYDAAFNGDRADDVVLAAVEDGPALRTALAEARRKIPGIARPVHVTVGDMVFLDPGRTALHY